MRRSTDKILTTHVGSLPDFVALDPNAPDHEAKLRALVADAVTKQRDDRARHHQRRRVCQVRRLAALRRKPARRLRAAQGRVHGVHRGQGPRGIRRVLQICDRTRHPILPAERGFVARGVFFRLHRADYLPGAGRDGARDRSVSRSARRASAAGCVSHHHGAGVARALSQERVLQDARRNLFTPSPMRCASSTR